MSFDRIFRYEDRVSREVLRPGDRYKVDMLAGYVGTSWWRWGDLDGDLMEKGLCAWQEGNRYDDVEGPSDEDVRNEGWVLGGDPARLAFVDRIEGGFADGGIDGKAAAYSRNHRRFR